MVRGLDSFKAHFEGYEANYVLIGGTTASLAMDEAGLKFRATVDLDIVLCVEALDPDFVRKFWEFVQTGNYQNRQKSTGDRQFYRFCCPGHLRDIGKRDTPLPDYRLEAGRKRLIKL